MNEWKVRQLLVDGRTHTKLTLSLDYLHLARRCPDGRILPHFPVTSVRLMSARLLFAHEREWASGTEPPASPPAGRLPTSTMTTIFIASFPPDASWERHWFGTLFRADPRGGTACVQSQFTLPFQILPSPFVKKLRVECSVLSGGRTDLQGCRAVLSDGRTDLLGCQKQYQWPACSLHWLGVVRSLLGSQTVDVQGLVQPVAHRHHRKRADWCAHAMFASGLANVNLR